MSSPGRSVHLAPFVDRHLVTLPIQNSQSTNHHLVQVILSKQFYDADTLASSVTAEFVVAKANRRFLGCPRES